MFMGEEAQKLRDITITKETVLKMTERLKFTWSCKVSDFLFWHPGRVTVDAGAGCLGVAT